ncbi:hypothetical protein LEP1GSC196_2619 [Leptospira meyeri serovar Semaranga str. Veldrot Semarang 173]|nr:hypothetical protein LEP1GSC196_2619 [Leptospira meyeri serovar Semaranga str. Veldrot Semarang 173]
MNEMNENAISEIYSFFEKTDKRVLFAGAGLSVPIYPNWNDLVKNIAIQGILRRTAVR